MQVGTMYVVKLQYQKSLFRNPRNAIEQVIA